MAGGIQLDTLATFSKPGVAHASSLSASSADLSIANGSSYTGCIKSSSENLLLDQNSESGPHCTNVQSSPTIILTAGAEAPGFSTSPIPADTPVTQNLHETKQTPSTIHWLRRLCRHFSASLSQTAHRVVNFDTKAGAKPSPLKTSDNSTSSPVSPYSTLPQFTTPRHLNVRRKTLSSRYHLIPMVRCGLYHPLTKSSILALIVLQVAIIIIDGIMNREGQETYRNILTPIEIGIFSLFTLEIGCKGLLHYKTPRKIITSRWRWPVDRLSNAVDFISVCAFWTKLIALAAGASQNQIVNLLSMMSALRILRLLRITSATDNETTVIIAALRESSMKLAEVTAFICFFWLLFAVIGLQTFHSSLQRSCVPPPFLDRTNTTLTLLGHKTQLCGGHLENHSVAPWLRQDGSSANAQPRGYICPQGLVCQESQNPHNGTVSFDNIFQSLELVFVIFSANTFSALMYDVIDTEGLVAALFFVATIIILYFWLVILFIGAITGSIQEIRYRFRSDIQMIQSKDIPKRSSSNSGIWSFSSRYLPQNIVEHTGYLWILVIVFGVTAQSLKAADMSLDRKKLLDRCEIGVTFTLLGEIVLRILLRRATFFSNKQNVADLGLAVITSTMQIPSFRRWYSGRVYTWFTIFQLARSYRAFWAVPLIRDILTLVFGCLQDFLQLCAFLFLLVFFAALLASKMFMIDAQIADDPFADLWKSFLSMYQIFTGEDWTQALYSITSRGSGEPFTWLGAMFIIGWFILSSIIVLNMFLARIDDSFHLPDHRKRLFQIRNFLRGKCLSGQQTQIHGYTQVSKLQSTMQASPGHEIDAHMQSTIETFTGGDWILQEIYGELYPAPHVGKLGHLTNLLHRIFTWLYLPSRRKRFGGDKSPESTGKSANKNIFKKIQSFCIMLVIPTGQAWSWVPGDVFRVFIYMSIIAQVIITCVVTPLYQREYFMIHEFGSFNWFVVIDVPFAALWTFEAFLKVIAGGFIRGEHAFLRGWNLIDAIVLVSIWAGIVQSSLNRGNYGAGLLIPSFKALRVLRLLTINEKVMREVTLVLRRGGSKVMASILVSLSLLVPFAIYGLNLFIDQPDTCNDNDILNLEDCILEFDASEVKGLLMPRTSSLPWHSFNTFDRSFYTLFLIVTQDGWTDVMYWARGLDSGIHGKSQSPSNMNAMFFIVFNFCGTIFVVALFTAVMIRNYTEATGLAYLTRNQRSWIEQCRLLNRVGPHRHPAIESNMPPLKHFCYEFSVRKDIIWRKFVVSLYLSYLLLLCIDFHPTSDRWTVGRSILLLAISALLSINTGLRLYGLTRKFFFRRPWDILSAIVLSLNLTTSTIGLFSAHNTFNISINRITQPAVVLLVIPYISTFQNLLDIAFASIPLVTTLLATWIVLLLFFAIGLNQAFGLTRFGANETAYVNFRSVPKALVLLFRMTLGEGGTKIMEDFAYIMAPYCVVGERSFESDCGDYVMARASLIAWKVLSTYLFTSLFTSLVFDSFSCVYRDFPLTSGVVEHEDIQRFKDAWAIVDPDGTGYIPAASLPKFANAIEGRLGLSVYDEMYSVDRLLKESKYTSPLYAGDMDISVLNQRLSGLDLQKMQERRRTMQRYRMELLLVMQRNPGMALRGISMNLALITLFYHKLVDLREYLPFEEFSERTERLRDVDEALRRESLKGLLRMRRCRREYSKHDIQSTEQERVK